MTIELNRECTPTKICTKCKIEKPLDRYGNAGRGDDRLRSYCKDCAAVYRNDPEARARFKANSSRYNANRKAKYDPEREKYIKIQRNYNLTKDEYDAMYEAQAGLCAICSNPGDLAIDHDHACCSEGAKSCGQCVRGLLCMNCNNGLGRFKDDIGALQKAIEYLRR